jgi:hypothetical protein
MNFEIYYNSFFRDHYNKFVGQLPDESKFHDDQKNKEIITIQRGRLTSQYNYLDFLNKNEYDYFSISLFFTILIDMVFYSKFKPYYFEFQSLTKYPKLIGDCPGGCRFHLEPFQVFESMEYDFRNDTKIKDSVSAMKAEIILFFQNHFTDIEGETFWNQIKIHIPNLNHSEL